MGYSVFLQEPGRDSDLVMSPTEQEPNQHLTPMDRRAGISGSSKASHRSTNSFGDTNYTALSPETWYTDSPRSDIGFTHRESGYEQTQSFSTPGAAPISPGPTSGLPVFNIEKDGDPNIHWKMYYNFVVTKQEAYYQLQQGYVVTDKYPLTIKSERVVM
jgi:hypothetical protein